MKSHNKIKQTTFIRKWENKLSKSFKKD